MVLVLNEDEAKSLTSVADAIPVIEQSFKLLGQRRAYTPPRVRTPTGFDASDFHEGFLQWGPANMSSENLTGFKFFANFGSRDLQDRYGSCWNHIFDLKTGELLAIMRSRALSGIRTAATSGVAARYLSSPSASSVAVYGPGKLAEKQLEAICLVRPIKKAYIYGRNKEKCDAFALSMSERLKIDITPLADPEAAAAKADIIVTCTTSFQPILLGKWLKKPVTLLGVGANHWNRRELDDAVFSNADLIVADERETAKVESGALLTAVHNGVVTWDQVENLADIVSGRIRTPAFDTARIVFCSHGLALEDVAISAQVYERAKAKGVGRNIEI